MSFISRIVRFLLWLLIVSWSVALLRRLVAWMLRGGEPQPQTEQQRVDTPGNSGEVAPSRRLVRDPVCGAHVAEVLAIPLREGGQLLHFCSVACRDQHLLAGGRTDTKKMAATG
jgi:hypothetical protein